MCACTSRGAAQPLQWHLPTLFFTSIHTTNQLFSRKIISSCNVFVQLLVFLTNAPFPPAGGCTFAACQVCSEGPNIPNLLLYIAGANEHAFMHLMFPSTNCPFRARQTLSLMFIKTTLPAIWAHSPLCCNLVHHCAP
jgi:hypothetical protein